MRTDYLIDDYQRTYFVIDDFEELFEAAYNTDFAPIYERYRDTPGLAPGEVLEGDRIVSASLPTSAS
jgi:phenylalanine-4-hydroxylase